MLNLTGVLRNRRIPVSFHISALPLYSNRGVVVKVNRENSDFGSGFDSASAEGDDDVTQT